MTEPLTPETIETLAAGYVVGDLDRAELEAFEQLLAENPALRAEVERIQATLDQVVYSFNSIEPPPHLQSAILAAANPVPTKSRLPWRMALGSVAALLILYLGIDNSRLRQDYRMAQDLNTLLQQSQTKLFSLKAVNASETAEGSFVVNVGQRQGILTAQNLAAPPPGKVYRLWAISAERNSEGTADGEKIPCGTLTLTPEGKVFDKYWMPADFYDTGISGLFVTLESSETSRYPTGAIVMQSQASLKI